MLFLFIKSIILSNFLIPNLRIITPIFLITKRAVSNPIMSNDTALFLVLREIKVSNQEVRILSDVEFVSNIFYGNYLSSCNM